MNGHTFDVVITWVNGDDAQWRAKRALHSTAENALNTLATANVEGRFRNNGELAFLLRSIRVFCEDVGKIFVVTDGQQPNVDGDDIPAYEVVDHRDFIDQTYLPTFSSRAIEASLHLIPGLSEHFVAFNDDVFITRQCGFDDFFSRRGVVVYVSDEALPNASSRGILSGPNDALNARTWMLENIGRSSIDTLVEHSPKGVIRSQMLEMELRFPEVFDDVRLEKFRRLEGQSILANLYGDWAVTNGFGEIRINGCAYLTTDDLEKNFEHCMEFVSAEVLNKKLSLCVNDTGDDRDISLAKARLEMMLRSIYTSAVEVRSVYANYSNAVQAGPLGRWY